MTYYTCTECGEVTEFNKPGEPERIFSECSSCGEEIIHKRGDSGSGGSDGGLPPPMR